MLYVPYGLFSFHCMKSVLCILVFNCRTVFLFSFSFIYTLEPETKLCLYLYILQLLLKDWDHILPVQLASPSLLLHKHGAVNGSLQVEINFLSTPNTSLLCKYAWLESNYATYEHRNV